VEPHRVHRPLAALAAGPGLAVGGRARLGVAERVLVNAKTGRGAYAELAFVPITAPAATPVFALALRRTAAWNGRTYG
jgi:hypothetical protein